MAGQGALSRVATATVAYWFDKRRGLALGITGVVGSAGISLAPVLIERLVSEYGWRQAWAIEGIAVWAVVLPLALFGIRNRPADVGQHVDGITPDTDTDTDPDAPLTGWPLRKALHTSIFWAVAACLAASSMLTTGLNFHQVSLLGDRGLTPAEDAANFLPQTAAPRTGAGPERSRHGARRPDSGLPAPTRRTAGCRPAATRRLHRESERGVSHGRSLSPGPIARAGHRPRARRVRPAPPSRRYRNARHGVRATSAETLSARWSGSPSASQRFLADQSRAHGGYTSPSAGPIRSHVRPSRSNWDTRSVRRSSGSTTSH